MVSPQVMNKVLAHAVKQAGLWGADQELAFPLITKTGVNDAGRTIRYYFNYSDHPVEFVYPHGQGTELIGDTTIQNGQTIGLERWGVKIIEES